jgi:hypothetical protein
MSRFISEAVQEKLGGARDELRRQYMEARKDNEREQELADWDAVSAEGWH